MDLRTFCQRHSQALLAQKLGVSSGLISQWVSGKTSIVAERAVEIEKATNGAVARWELRPDLWSPPEKGDAA